MKFFLAILSALLLIPAVWAHETGGSRLELPPGVQQVGEYQQNLALNVNLLIAFLAGIIGFVSPCSFAVFPAFFSVLFKERKRAVFLTTAFTFGIMLSFVLMGIAAGALGVFFNQLKREFALASGLLLVFFGLLLLLNKGFTFLTFRMDHPQKQKTFFTMTSLGFFFALGWTPCVGPILSGILLLAANTGTAITGGIMLAAYALGVAVPLLLVAFLSDKYDFSRFFQRGHIEFSLFGRKIHTHAYNIIGGLLLIGLGAVIAIFRGSQAIEQFLVEYTPWKMDWLYAINDAVLASPLTDKIADIIGVIFLLAVVTFAVKALLKKYNTTKFK